MLSFKDKLSPLLQNIKNIINHAEITRAKAIFLYSFIVVFYSNFLSIIRFIRYNFRDYGVIFSITYSISGLLIMIILISFMFFICSFFGGKFLKFCGIIFAIAGSVYNLFVAKFNVFISLEVISDILGGNGNDIAYAFFDWKIFPIVIIFGIFPALLIFKIKIRTISKFNFFKYTSRYVKVVLVLVVISYLVCGKAYKTKYMDNIKKQIVPISIFHATKDLSFGYRHAMCVIFDICSKREKLHEYDIENFEYTKKNKEPVIGIFLIGESLRSDRLSVNGYKRKTTPFLDRAIKNQHLFVFPNVETCDVLTESSVRCLMSKNDVNTWLDKKRISTKAFSSILTGLGFETYFYANQHSVVTDSYMKKFYDVKYHLIREELQEIDNKKDGFYFDRYIIEHLNKDVKTDTIYVIHTEGNHQPYGTKYTEKQNIFGEETDSDKYDNATFAFDDFFQELTEKFKDKNAFIMYVSDHGESFGEINPHTGEETWFHGVLKRDKSPIEQKIVPIIFWASNKFAQKNVEKIDVLKKLHKDRFDIYFSHDSIWHSFLDCLDVKSDEIDKKLSICSNQFLIKPSYSKQNKKEKHSKKKDSGGK